ncbi:MAG: hypothetical protein LBF15_06330 [Candidatus Peribacteria bacterium]|nr:hypothetical protein [Candidatus Peribacteria bacterium]
MKKIFFIIFLVFLRLDNTFSALVGQPQQSNQTPPAQTAVQSDSWFSNLSV